MLSSLRPPNGKFVLGPPVETEPPVKVFTGPADHPDAVQTAEPRVEEEKAARQERRPASKKETAAKTDGIRKTAPKPRARPSTPNTAKPKVSSAN